MALTFPYTYISCPCSDASRRALASAKRTSRELDVTDLDQQDESSFDPKHPRASYSLFPPEHLFYCEDCRDLKCPRCVVEEIVCWFCPHCLFDAVPSSVKADGNRCSRNCVMCPICQSQLSTSSISSTSKPLERPYILTCQYCMWTSLDAGIDFANPSGIRQQLQKREGDGRDARKGSASTGAAKSSNYLTVNRARGLSSLSKEYTAPATLAESQVTETNQSTRGTGNVPDHQTQFNNLKQFYKEQLLASDTSQSSSAFDAAFSSPSSLTRLMNLYSSGGSMLRKQKQKTTVMREATDISEGLHVSQTQYAQTAFQYPDAVSKDQLSFQYPAPIGNTKATHTSQLRPIPTLLRTKRSKRCAACKHILVKPELKVTSTRYRIKLVALNYIPFISLKPVPSDKAPVAAGPDGDPSITLEPAKPSQWILTLKNPLFENVNVSLGSPSVTPGKHGHKVTILCPQFSIGKNGDVWDEAALAQPPQPPQPAFDPRVSQGPGAEQVAGKVYDRGRNWTSIVVEVVPASILTEVGQQPEQDETVIEIPIRVRLEWKITDEQALRNENLSKKEDDTDIDDGSRELAYWTVIGIGRVSI